MIASTKTFDHRLTDWQEHQDTPWSRLYYRISRANLDRHLPQGDESLSVLDAGGGNGADAIHHAIRGHAVALVDHSSEMLAEAERRAAEAGVASKVTCHQADILDIPRLFPGTRFDLVLCHSVAHYMEDVGLMLQAACLPLRAEGLLSLISINRYSEAMREALLWHQPESAARMLGSRTAYSSVFDTTIKLRTAAELIDQIEEADCTVLAQYGVRCVNDYISDNAIKFDPEFFAQLERLELSMTGRFPYYLLARHFQIIACNGPVARQR